MRYQLYQGDCLEVMREMPDASVDAIVTDPPYGLSFMGKKWDYDVPSEEIWRECLRVLKPGGHLLAFAGTRTQHRMAVRIEDAGFEIRDMIAWVYGCLSEDTQAVTIDGLKKYNEMKEGDLVLCYDPESGAYGYHPVLEVVEYDYSDTAFRIIGDFGEQIVSRNHRVLVEQDGREVFQLAETLECEARVPILEGLSDLRKILHRDDKRAGGEKQDMRDGMQGGDDITRSTYEDPTGVEKRKDDILRGVRNTYLEAGRLASEGIDPDLQLVMQREASCEEAYSSLPQGEVWLDEGIRGCSRKKNDGRGESELEGRRDLSEQERSVCKSADKIREMSIRDLGDGEIGWLRDGAQDGCRNDNRKASNERGVCTSHQSRRHGQSLGEPYAFSNEWGTQEVRAWSGHKTHLVRVVPFHYTGKVWCLRVPTGCFVAYRDGVAFPTGNSGFPKSHDVSKAIDKIEGHWRGKAGAPISKNGSLSNPNYERTPKGDPITAAATAWNGWGTSLKPSLEPVTVARKPFKGTVAANVLEHGTGALNIDGCRVPSDDDVMNHSRSAESAISKGKYGDSKQQATHQTASQKLGRWPANFVHDGSDEVLALFPETKKTAGAGWNGLGDTPRNTYNGGWKSDGINRQEHGDNGGSAARFFYCAKASKKDRGEGNNHPTVKPTNLLKYLCRLVAPPDGVILDPFMGSGSTGKAAMLEGFRFIGIEREEEYFKIAKARIKESLE